MAETTTVALSKDLHDWLIAQGRKNESFDKLLRRLLGFQEVKPA